MPQRFTDSQRGPSQRHWNVALHPRLDDFLGPDFGFFVALAFVLDRLYGRLQVFAKKVAFGDWMDETNRRAAFGEVEHVRLDAVADAPRRVVSAGPAGLRLDGDQLHPAFPFLAL